MNESKVVLTVEAASPDQLLGAAREMEKFGGSFASKAEALAYLNRKELK